MTFVPEGTDVSGEPLAGRIAVMPLISPICEEAQDASRGGRTHVIYQDES
jgi:hypothetical protein